MNRRSITTIALVAIVLLSACTSIPRNESGGLSEAASIPVTDFAVGDCFDDPTVFEVEEVEGLPCETAHDNEVFAIFDHEDPDQSWPGQDALDEYSYFACIDQFEAYVGADYVDSRLEVSFFSPLEDGWDSGDHEIVCFLFDIDFAKLTKSMRGSGE